MNARRGLWIVSVLLIGMLRGVFAQDITVTRMDDPPPDGCTPTDCSLREAVAAANVDPAAYNDIYLGAGTYQVNDTSLDVTGGTRFHGAGSTQTMIRGDGVANLMTFSGPHQLTLDGLALDAQGKIELLAANGNAVRLYRMRAPNPLGRIVVESADGTGGSFSIGESEILATVYSEDKNEFTAFDSRLLRLNVVSVTGNASHTEVWMNNVVVDGSLAPDAPSSVNITTYATAALSGVAIEQTTGGLTFRGDSALGSGELAVDRLHYVGNRRPLGLRYAYATIERSEFLQNVNTDIGDAAPGAMRLDNRAIVVVQDSTFAGNTGSSTSGGAIRIGGSDATLNVRNSTFSGNLIAADAAGQPGGARGAAVGWSADATNVSVLLRHVTMVAPTVLPVGVSGSTVGGFGDSSEIELRIVNSIVRGSCRFSAASLVDASGNIESSSSSCGFPAGANQNGVSTAALALGSLGYHGGYTQTILPGSTSVAIDAGSSAYCLPTDQRGYARETSACDVGAVERGDVIFADGLD